MIRVVLPLSWAQIPGRLLAAGVAAAFVFLLAATAPHRVHHLFDPHPQGACLLSVQASHMPELAATAPSIVPAQAMAIWKPGALSSHPQVLLLVTVRPRAPPSVHV